MNERLKARLVELLIAALPKVTVNNARFINRLSRLALFEADNALPDHGPFKEQLVSQVDDFPIVTFVSDYLQSEIFDSQEYDSEKASQKLTEIAAFANPKAVATHLVDEFETLPWKYVLSIKMPSEIGETMSQVIDNTYGLSSNLKLVKITDEFSKIYPLNHKNEKRQEFIHGGSLLFPATDDKEWTEGIYLQIECEGYIGLFGGTTPALQGECVLKSFLGLGLALKLFDFKSSYFPVPPKHQFYVHKLTEEKWEIETKLELNVDLSRAISDLQLNGIITRAATDQRKKDLLKLILSEMNAVFSSGEQSEALTLAAEWLLDSYAGRDDRLNYVQAMVVLEVLLGDKATSDVVGLGQLLRNRCAYLIGKNKEERDTLLKDFDEIYKIRSQIVHRGKARLNFRERLQFSKLRDICNRVIQREVDLLRAK